MKQTIFFTAMVASCIFCGFSIGVYWSDCSWSYLAKCRTTPVVIQEYNHGYRDGCRDGSNAWIKAMEKAGRISRAEAVNAREGLWPLTDNLNHPEEQDAP